MTRNDDLVTAFHEAGHAVLARSCGLAISSISIEPDQSTRGRVTLDLTPEQQLALSDDDPVILNPMTIVTLGGIAADYGLWKRDPKAKPTDAPKGHFQDQRQAQDGLSRLGREPSDIHAYLAVTVQHVDRSDIWSAIHDVAMKFESFSFTALRNDADVCNVGRAEVEQ